jgi:hypothetical protein
LSDQLQCSETSTGLIVYCLGGNSIGRVVEARHDGLSVKAEIGRHWWCVYTIPVSWISGIPRCHVQLSVRSHVVINTADIVEVSEGFVPIRGGNSG